MNELSKDATELLIGLRAGMTTGLVAELIAAGYLTDTGQALPTESDVALLDALMARAEAANTGMGANPRRRELLGLAIAAGCDDKTMTSLVEAVRLSPKDTILLPAGRFQNLSRGKGWARKGKGDAAEWGEAEGNSYRVGPGKWTVGSNDGFNRKSSETWTVRHVKVGEETWTVAS